MLLRSALGETLRHARTRQSRTLRDVSTVANISLGYLSEVERGQKEASSELLASICEALDLDVSDILDTASSAMRSTAAVAVAPDRKSLVATTPFRATVQQGAHDEDIRIVVPYRRSRLPA